MFLRNTSASAQSTSWPQNAHRWQSRSSLRWGSLSRSSSAFFTSEILSRFITGLERCLCSSVPSSSPRSCQEFKHQWDQQNQLHQHLWKKPKQRKTNRKIDTKLVQIEFYFWTKIMTILLINKNVSVITFKKCSQLCCHWSSTDSPLKCVP